MLGRYELNVTALAAIIAHCLLCLCIFKSIHDYLIANIIALFLSYTDNENNSNSGNNNIKLMILVCLLMNL